MDEFQWALVVGAGVTALIALPVPRSLLWIGLGAASFVASTVWQKYGLPYKPGFGIATDFVILGLIWVFARQRWEMRVANCFQLMILLDILFLAGVIQSHFWLVVSLEIANWLALLVIAVTGLIERTHDVPAHWRGDSWLGSLHRSLHAERGRSGRF